MKLDPHLPQLPSIGELLEHPRVKGVVERINRSTLAHRAAGFLDELRSSLVERAGRVEIPSVAHLAERLARRLLGEPLADGPVINATGVVVGDPELAPPLAEGAVHAMLQQASEYHGRGVELRHASERDLCHLTGAESALVVGSFDAALQIMLAAIAANREILVYEQPELAGSSLDWRLLAARTAAILRTSTGDAAALVAAVEGAPQLAAIVRSSSAEGLATTAEVAAIARRRGAAFIDVAPLAGVINPAVYGLQSTQTLRERLEAGADLVVVDGAGLLGGPTCGVMVGQRRLVELAANHPVASFTSIDPFAAAALRATLAAYRHDEAGVMFTIPVWQLLSSPTANLQQRAERLASLIAASPAIASAVAEEVASPWRRTEQLAFSRAGWSISVRPNHGDGAVLAAALRKAPQPIVAQAIEGGVRLHLRSVFPRWDQQLVTSLEATAK